MPPCTPQFSLLLEPSTAVFRVCCGTLIRGCLVGHIYQSIYSFPGSPQQRPCISVSAGPFGTALNHDPIQTAVIFVCIDSFIQALTAKHKMLIPSHTHAMRHTVLVTASAARLSNPGDLRWSPHLVPISHTSH